MTKPKLNFRFHNPNTAEDTAEVLVKLLIAANQPKLERAIQTETKYMPPETQKDLRST